MEKQNKQDIEREKFILDACCGAKFIWIDKNNPFVVFNDIRKEYKGFIGRRKNIEIMPDINCDFRKLPFLNNKFKLIIFDPPHILGNMDKSTLKACYGVLNKDTYENMLKEGIIELWRVLDNYGILLFKFNNVHISFENILNLFPDKPLIQTSTNRSKNTESRWFVFMKIPKELNNGNDGIPPNNNLNIIYTTQIMVNNYEKTD
jgi:hypothetical protein